MASYDASIRVGTKIDVKSAEVQLSTLENRIVKTSDKIASLRSKMNAMKDVKIPTAEYRGLQKELDKLVQKQNKYNEQLKEFDGVRNKENLPLFQEISSKLEESYTSADRLISKMRELSDTGKAFTLGSDTEVFAKLGQQLRYAKNDLSVLNKRHSVLDLKLKKSSDGYKKLGDTAKKSFNSVGTILKKTNSHVNSFGKRLNDITHRILPTFHKEAKRTNTVLGQFSGRLKSLLSGIFIFNTISAGFRKLFSGVGESFKNFYDHSKSFRSSVDNMRVSLAQLRNSIAAAFAPIISVAIPYLEKLISYITSAINSFGQLISALLGKKTYTKAKKVYEKDLEDTSDAFEDVRDSAEEAEKAVEGYLNPLDDVNRYVEDKEIKNGIDIDKKPELPGTGDAVQDLFEEVPIDSYFLDLVDKMKELFSQFFAPLKEAWNREGKYVIDSWKYALQEIGELIKSIGSDFLEVWQQERTIKIFEDLLHIIGDIGLVVGNLAHNFRLAWEENETGKRILEGIRDIIGVIVANIRHAADATVEWSENLDFSPLLTKIEGWIESLVPVFNNLSGIITDFYEKVLLPLGKWTLEKGLPELLQVFIDFNNKVDWEALRERLTQFWEHLEPFAETVGEGLIIFIERCANALADFINSPAFDNFLTMIENWMDSVSPEDVADALEAIAKAIITLKVAVVGFSAVSKGVTLFSKLVDILKFFGGSGGSGTVLSGLKSIGSTIAGWAPHIAVGTAIVGVFGEIKKAMEAKFDTSNWDVLDWITSTLEVTVNSWKQKFEGFKISLELWWQDTWFSNAIWNFEQWWSEKIDPWFTQERWSQLWESVKQSVSTKWEEIKTTLIAKVEEIKASLSAAWESMKQTAVDTWNMVKETIIGIWQNLNQNAIEVWEGIKQFFIDTWESIKTTVSEVWENITTFLQEKWEHIKETVTTIFENIKTFLQETWEAVKEKIVEVWDSITEKVSDTIQVIREKISDVMGDVKEKWSGAWDTMREKVTSIIDGVKNTIQSAFDWIAEKVNAIAEKLSSVGDKAKSLFSFGGGTLSFKSSIFKKTSTYSLSRTSAPRSLYLNPAVAALSDIEFPAYATGQVIPRTMKQHLAILGDNDRETEVVSPLSTMKQAFMEAMREMGGMGGNGQPIILKVILDSKEILYAMVKEGKIVQMSTGRNIFALE